MNYGNYNYESYYHASPPADSISIELEEKPLWSSFASHTNEMILTKAGRRTFPLIRLSISGLEDTALYTVQLEFAYADNFKYKFANGEWKTSPRTEPSVGGGVQRGNKKTAPIIYEHPDSPKFGSHWCQEKISFTRLKLTNNEAFNNTSSGYTAKTNKNVDLVYLKSLCKYDCIIHLYKHDKKNLDDKFLVYSKCLDEARFIAVTAYQNSNITNLKIRYNPYAKAFQNNRPLLTVENNCLVLASEVEAKNGPKQEKKRPLEVTTSRPPLKPDLPTYQQVPAQEQSQHSDKTEATTALYQNYYNYYNPGSYPHNYYAFPHYAQAHPQAHHHPIPVNPYLQPNYNTYYDSGSHEAINGCNYSPNYTNTAETLPSPIINYYMKHMMGTGLKRPSSDLNECPASKRFNSSPIYPVTPTHKSAEEHGSSTGPDSSASSSTSADEENASFNSSSTSSSSILQNPTDCHSNVAHSTASSIWASY